MGADASNGARQTAEYWKAEHLAGNKRIAALEVELLTAIARMRTAIHMLDAGNTKGQVRLWLDGYCNTDMTEKQK